MLIHAVHHLFLFSTSEGFTEQVALRQGAASDPGCFPISLQSDFAIAALGSAILSLGVTKPTKIPTKILKDTRSPLGAVLSTQR